jgi:hypothetical protein
MAAEDYVVHRCHRTSIPLDHLDIWRPTLGHGEDGPCTRIDQSDGVSDAVYHHQEDAAALARAILEPAAIDQGKAFAGEPPELQSQ